MPRLVFMTGVALCVLAAAFLVTERLLYPQCLENARRGRPGMTLKQVEEVFGRPGHDNEWVNLVLRLRTRYDLSGFGKLWEDRMGTAVVCFRRDNDRLEAVVGSVLFLHRPTKMCRCICGDTDDGDWLAR